MNAISEIVTPPTRVRNVTAAAVVDVLAADLIPGAWEVVHIAADLATGLPARVCLLDPALTGLGWAVIGPTVAAALTRPDLLTLLIEVQPPPPVTGCGGRPVLSFVGPARLLPEIAGPLDQLCFAALEPLMSGTPPAGVGVVARECPPPDDGLPEWNPAADSPTAAVVMAHRGSSDHLRAALAALANARPGPTAVRVGLDGDLPPDFREVAARFPGVELYADPSAGRVGPYVIRQTLVTATPEPVVVFHDSDDVSTADRFHWLLAGQARTGGLVGSYELQFDPDDREVRTSRYPPDGNAALRVEARHPLLHPTSALPVEAFVRAGGFGTDCVFGNDVQFLFRASLHVRVTNVPRFLYVRRLHAESLTSHPDTGMDNPLRGIRNRRWRADYAAIVAGALAPADSSLVPGVGPAWRPTRVPEGLP